MKKEVLQAKGGAIIELTISENGNCFCPVCGSESKDKDWRPYDKRGFPSYDICSCGFEYGFDDAGSPPYDKSWALYREKWLKGEIENEPTPKLSLSQKKEQLKNIGY